MNSPKDSVQFGGHLRHIAKYHTYYHLVGPNISISFMLREGPKDSVAIRHTPEIKGGLKTLKDKGLKIFIL
jgi:hypothetical protein